MLEELHRQAERLNLQVVQYDIKNPPGPDSTVEIAQLINSMQTGDFDAYFHLAGPVVNFPDNQQLLMQIGERFNVPSAYLQNFASTDSWLFSYGHDLYGTGAQAAPMAHKIFSGVAPSNIPIEYQDKDLFVVNLRAASAIGVVIPASLLEIADIRIPAE
jgi:putative ABC transport system substrate-binding protein